MKRILISGISGFVGSHLKSEFERLGHRVCGLTRSSGEGDSYRWDPDTGEVPQAAFEGADVVINLAGASIAGSRWTSRRKQILRDSRILSTRTLVAGMLRCSDPPPVLISMSGVNYYPYGNTPKTENNGPGDSFLSNLCIDWESETKPAQQQGIRTVLLRLGVVLDKSGGALEKMLPAFRIGAGGPIGSGRQGFPWISLKDLARVIDFAIDHPSLIGPVNAVHPEHVSQGEFATALGHALNRPAFAKLPTFMVRLMFGQMGDEMLLGDLHVHPEKLIDSGFVFSEENLQQCLNKMFAVN